MSGILYIPLKEYFKTDTLRHRETAIAIGEMANGLYQIILDFNGIFFASNAFCNELYSLARKYFITIVNASPNITNMMRATARQILEKCSDSTDAVMRIRSITIILNGREMNVFLEDLSWTNELLEDDKNGN